MRSVEITEANVLKYMTREWFPKTLNEIARDFTVRNSSEYVKLLGVVLTLSKDNNGLVWFIHPVRIKAVFTTSTNPTVKSLLPSR